MGLIGAFKSIGRALGKATMRSGRLLSKLDDIPGVPNVVAMIPIAGPVLAAAARRCNMAESLFSSGMGEQKKQWARAQLTKDLRNLGVEEKYIDELVSVGLLVTMKHAAVREFEERPRPAREKPVEMSKEEPEAPSVDTPEPDPDDVTLTTSEGSTD